MVLAVGIASCGGHPVPVDPNANTALFRFDVSSMVRNSSMLPRPPVGTVYGNIFLSEDVSISGPRMGAMQFGDVQLDVDLTNGISDIWNFVTRILHDSDPVHGQERASQEHSARRSCSQKGTHIQSFIANSPD